MGFGGSKGNSFVYFRGKADNKPAGKAFLGFDIELFAGCKIVVNGFFECLAQFFG